MLIRILITFFLINIIYCEDSYQPRHVHLALGEDVSEIVVTWSTLNKTEESVVEYGIGGFILTATGTSTLFVDGGSAKLSQYIHRVKLSNLTPKSKYVYHCGSKQGWSNEFWFNTLQQDAEWVPRIALFGDMGVENAQALNQLQEETQREMYDTILHVGDFAYDMHSDNGKIGDAFMQEIEPIAAYVPYMACPGNHEERYNFSNYRNRFSMPGGTESIMYSFNIGPIHFISISTELYYFMEYGLKPLVLQYEWLEQDLIEANKPENRKIRPWIVTMGHRPMYCSNSNNDDCTHHETLIRVGLPFLHYFGLEELFYRYGVDLEIWAHEHSYERLWPIYDYKVYNGSYEEPYVNPRAPVHIVTGSGGCKEGRENFVDNPPSWSATHSRDYGFTRMIVPNRTHLYMEQISVDKSGEVIDSFWIVKNRHGSYTNP